MKKVERAAGVLFLLSTGAFMMGSSMLGPILDRTDVPLGMMDDRSNVILGMFLELINALAVVGIAILLQPILKKHHEVFALGYFAARVMEATLLMMSVMCPLLLLVLSDKTIVGSSADGYLQTIGHAAVEAHFLLFDMAMIVLSIGSLLFCTILYRSRLVPRWLSVIGLIGYTGLLASSSLAIGGLEAGSVLYAPGALFEIALPVWLFVKGLQRPSPLH